MARTRLLLVVAGAALACGCAIRYDHAGVSRVGIGLWGFGDPPGVNWNLDWPTRREWLELPPHREPPDLPPHHEPPELPPRSPREVPDWPHSLDGALDEAPPATQRGADARRTGVIDDDRCPAAAGERLARCISPSARADPRGSSTLRS